MTGYDKIAQANADEETLDTIYSQLIDYLLQISQLEFPQIGAISKDASDTWTVTGKPLTYNMNELASSTGYPVDQFRLSPSTMRVASSSRLRISISSTLRPNGTSPVTKPTFESDSSLVIDSSSSFQSTASRTPVPSRCSAMACNLRTCLSTQTPSVSPP